MNTFFRVFFVAISATEDPVHVPFRHVRGRQGSVETDVSTNGYVGESQKATSLADFIKIRLIVKQVPRVGLALGVELDCELNGNHTLLPLVKIKGRLERTGKEFCLRAGFRTSDFLRETDSKGFWTDLVPIEGVIEENEILHVACLVEIDDVWK
jgi:hypothetical protein